MKFIFYISLVLIFESEIRSIGVSNLPMPTATLIPGLWLRDVGLLIPIFFWLKNLRAVSRQTRWVIGMHFSLYIYGLLLSLIYFNGVVGIGDELRLFLSFYSGISLILIIKSKLISLINFINLFFVILLLFICVQLFATPQSSIGLEERISSYTLYNLAGIILLVGPTLFMMSCYLNFNRVKLIMIFVWLCLIFILVFLAKTRSFSIVFIAGLFIMFYGLNYINWNLFSKIKIRKKNTLFYISFSIIFILFSILNSDGLLVFISRSQTIDLSGIVDINILYRFNEALVVFDSTSLVKLLFGSGLNPPMLLEIINEHNDIVRYNAMHIGILNYFWRFGVFVSTFFLFLSYKIIFSNFNSLKYLKTKSNIFINNFKNVSLLMVVPSIFLYILSSSMSGGYSIVSFLSLGMILGLYEKFNTSSQASLGYARVNFNNLPS